MDYQEAKRLLHPDTTRDAIWEIADKQEALKKINEACLLACEAMDELQELQTDTRYSDDTMTLDEAIIHSKEISKRNRVLANSDILVQKSYGIDIETMKCTKCAEEHEQLARWLEELKLYKQIGNPEEIREAMDKQKAKKPIYKHYEDIGEPPYIKIACPNGCGIQLHPVTDKHLAHEHDYCPKCGQAIDWSEDE